MWATSSTSWTAISPSPVRSSVLEAAVPATLRDADGRWFALSMRARVLYADKDLNELTAITYEGLADPKWKGGLCLRSASTPTTRR